MIPPLLELIANSNSIIIDELVRFVQRNMILYSQIDLLFQNAPQLVQKPSNESHPHETISPTFAWQAVPLTMA